MPHAGKSLADVFVVTGKRNERPLSPSSCFGWSDIYLSVFGTGRFGFVAWEGQESGTHSTGHGG